MDKEPRRGRQTLGIPEGTDLSRPAVRGKKKTAQEGARKLCVSLTYAMGWVLLGLDKKQKHLNMLNMEVSKRIDFSWGRRKQTNDFLASSLQDDTK